MGPYALRSVNAYFKLWDDSVQDSFEENLSQAPVNVIPDIDVNCQCTTQTDGVCGGLPGSGCQPGFRGWTHTCIPQGSQCDGAPPSGCNFDPTCCQQMPAGCGSVALTQETNGCTNPPPAANNCYYGQILMASPCHTSPATPACPIDPTTCPPAAQTNCIPAPYCQADSTCPMPTCQGTLYPNATFCPGAQTGLNQNTPITYVASLANCPSSSASPAPCEAYCNSGYCLQYGTDGTTIIGCVAAPQDCQGNLLACGTSFARYTCTTYKCTQSAGSVSNPGTNSICCVCSNQPVPFPSASDLTTPPFSSPGCSGSAGRSGPNETCGGSGSGFGGGSLPSPVTCCKDNCSDAYNSYTNGCNVWAQNINYCPLVCT